jgi:anaphase-promoting complex subunit 10
VNFVQRQSVAEVALFLCFPEDQSYTPETLVISGGGSGGPCDLEELRRVRLVEPNGWVRIPLVLPGRRGLQRFARLTTLAIEIPTNHMSGRDLYLRGIQIRGPA